MPDFMRVEETASGVDVFVSLSTGHEIKCNPVARQMATIGTSIADPPKPAPPQYEMTGAGGAKEKRDHDEHSIQDPKTSDKERAAWDKYQARLEKWQAKVDENAETRDEMNARFVALRGFDVPGRPTDDELKLWAEEQELLFGVAPDRDNGLPERINVYLFWIEQMVLATEDDAKKVMLGIMRASGLDQEATDQAVSMFWGPLGNDSRSGADSDRDPRTLEGEAEEEERARLVTDPALS